MHKLFCRQLVTHLSFAFLFVEEQEAATPWSVKVRESLDVNFRTTFTSHVQSQRKDDTEKCFLFRKHSVIDSD